MGVRAEWQSLSWLVQVFQDANGGWRAKVLGGAVIKTGVLLGTRCQCETGSNTDELC